MNQSPSIQRNIDFTLGRDDVSVTVYVPWNCTNNCPFCSSKQDYAKIHSDIEKVKASLRLIRDSIMPIVVFTGGEPSSNVELLRELISIVDNKTVFINTSLPSRNAEAFIRLVNETDCVKSISISRHRLSYEEDCKILHGIAPDEMIATIRKPVRINVVQENENSFDISNVEKYVERWRKISDSMSKPGNLLLNLRGNFCLQTPETLHDMSGSKIINELATRYYYVSHGFCNVCDTCAFDEIDESGNTTFSIHYHRGLLHTSIRFGNICEINDIIILQDGSICYDWDGKNEAIEYFLSMISEKQ